RAMVESRRLMDEDNRKLLYWKEKAKTEESEREEQYEKVEDMKANLIELTEKAEGYCARVPVPRNATPAKIKMKLGQLHIEVKQFEAQLGATCEEIEQLFHEAQERYETAQKQIKEGTDLRTALGETYNHRQYRWRQFQIQITQRA